MKRYTAVCLFFLVMFIDVSFAESIDITKDLQKNINTQNPSHAPAANNSQTVAGQSDAADTEVMTDIYDIKSLESIGYDKRIIRYGIIFLAVLLLVGLLIYLIDYFIRRRKKEDVEEVIVIPADIEAYKLLDDLEKVTGLNAREYYFRLTSILRGYMGRRFEFEAPEMTTEELIPRINELDFGKQLKLNVKKLLTSTDPIKYAGAGAMKEKMDSDFKLVKDFIKQTPVEEAETTDSVEELKEKHV